MRYLAVFAALMGLVSLSLAQADTKPADAPGPDYKIQEEDVLSFTLAQGAEGTFRATVGPDGQIEYPHIGRVMVKGKTAQEVIADIVGRLQAADIYKSPTVNVVIEAYRRPRATVIGTDTVQRPNTFEFRLGQRLRDLLGMAGGVIYGAADLKHAVLSRKGSSERIPIDLRALLQSVRDDQNYVLQDGDVLTVPREEQGYVNVIGEVQSPGPMVYREGMRVSDAIAGAKGPIPERGSMARVTVFRPDQYDPNKSTEIQVNMFDAAKDISKDILLQKRDTIQVRKNNNIDVSRYNSIFNAVYVLTIVLRNNPFDALTGALRP